MITAKNPFRPTFGVPPVFWVGRHSVLDTFDSALSAGPGSAGRSLLISGARGIGKTVLLNEIEDKARTHGWICLRASGRGTMVKELVETTIPEALTSLSPISKRTISQIGVSGIGSIGFSQESSRSYIPNLKTELRALISQLKGTGVLLSIDEVQDADASDLMELATAYQDVIRDELDIALVAVGLPQGINRLLSLPGITFLRRAQKFVLGPFSPQNAAAAFRATPQDSGITFAPAAIDQAVVLSRGYPYMVQLVGSLAWDRAHRRGSHTITDNDIASIATAARTTLGVHVHQPALIDLSPGQRSFLEAMAHCIDPATGSSRIADIAATLGSTTKSLSSTRQYLLDADLIEPAGYGSLRFVIPYMEDILTHTDSLGRVD
nr:ATP-binding protein [Corynebacterium lizhenjunii]